MSATNDGGPAFPSEQGHIPNGTWNQTYEAGMSLRDWFAGQALAGMIAQPDERVCPKDRLPDIDAWRLEQYKIDAATCYAHADAMLAARGAK